MALIWTWSHHSLHVQEQPDDRWVSMFHALDDSDDCATDGVEVEGRYITAKEVREMPEYQAIEDEWMSRIRSDVARTKDYVSVQIRHPEKDNEWSVLGRYERDQAGSVVSQWSERVGADRVRIGPH